MGDCRGNNFAYFYVTLKTKASQSANKKKEQTGFIPLYLCFIDYSKAFDSVFHQDLWRSMT